MTQTPREAAEAMRGRAKVRARELYGHPLQEVLAGIHALPLPVPSEPTAEGQDELRRQLWNMTQLATERHAERDQARADLARMKAAMEELRAQIEPCGCKLGRCEQFPDKELLYYGRLCRDRAALDALKGTSQWPTHARMRWRKRERR